MIPFFDLKKQNEFLKKELNAAFQRVVHHTGFILGPEVEQFENNFAQFTGTQYAIGVNSGLDALSLALRVLNIGPGDEVIVPANSFIATALAVTSVGATVVFADAELNCLLLDLESVKKLITKSTKAVIPVHLYGQPVDMEALSGLCRSRRIHLVEDACQAHGASIGKRRCGSLGDLGCFSFYPGKNLGAFGDGGMITTDNKSFYEKLLLYRNYGSVIKYEHRVTGFNTRLDALQAAFLDIKLRYLQDWNKKREIIAKRYDDKLKNLPLQLLKRRKGYSSAHHLYIIRTDRREDLKNYLAKKEIGTSIHYPVPIHQQEAYKQLQTKSAGLPVAEKEAKRVLSLPLYPEMAPNDVDGVCAAIRNFFE